MEEQNQQIPESTISQPETQSSSLAKKPKKSLRRIIILVIAFLFLLIPFPTFRNNTVEFSPLILGLWKVGPSPTPTVDEMATWKTYTKQSKYATFKYPENWEISEFGEGNAEGGVWIITLSSYKIEECGTKDDCRRIDLQISMPTDGKSDVYDFVSALGIGEKKIYQKEWGVGTISYSRRQDVSINGILGLNYIVERTGKDTPSLSNYSLVKVNNNFYYISSSDNKLLNAFIKTLKIVK